jgi:hypothetical protein
MSKELLSEVRSHDDPIVLVWFGTCELTEKKCAGVGKYIKSRSCPYQNIEITVFLYSFIVLLIDIWKSHVYSPIYGL